MDIWYKIELVQKMQDYIISHADDDIFSYEDFYAHTGYSRRHADRYFKQFTGKTPREYLRLIQMSHSAEQLIESPSTVLEIALKTKFNSHEGYTKAFRETFGRTPKVYRQGESFIPLFIPYSIKTYYQHILGGKRNNMNNTCLCMITPIHRNRRKLIFMRSKKAYDYWTFCEEVGCDWEGLFNSNPQKLDTAALLTLPDFLMKEGYGKIAAGIEVPVNYHGEIPKNCETAELPPCEMLVFQSQKYKTSEEFFTLIGQLFKALEEFDYAANGYKMADDLAPRFNFGGQPETGAKLSVPIIKL